MRKGAQRAPGAPLGQPQPDIASLHVGGKQCPKYWILAGRDAGSSLQLLHLTLHECVMLGVILETKRWVTAAGCAASLECPMGCPLIDSCLSHGGHRECRIAAGLRVAWRNWVALEGGGESDGRCVGDTTARAGPALRLCASGFQAKAVDRQKTI